MQILAAFTVYESHASARGLLNQFPPFRFVPIFSIINVNYYGDDSTSTYLYKI